MLLLLEALDWLWLSNLVLLFITILKKSHRRRVLTIILFILSLIIYSWPLIYYSLEISLVFEILFFTIIALIIIVYTDTESPNSLKHNTIIMCINAVSLAFIIALNGSLLIAQLSIVLAATLSGFIFSSLRNSKLNKHLNYKQFIIAFNTYLSLLFLARMYAELSIVNSLFLALSPLTIVLLTNQYKWIVSLLIGSGSLIWILLASALQ